jgi:hypothetical protein
VWPVLELDGRIVWMKGVELETSPAITITIGPNGDAAEQPAGTPANAGRNRQIDPSGSTT